MKLNQADVNKKHETSSERNNKYLCPGSIFLHPVVCVCCIRSPVGIQTLQTSSHLPSWLQSSDALQSQDGIQSHARRRTASKNSQSDETRLRYVLKHMKSYRQRDGRFISTLDYGVWKWTHLVAAFQEKIYKNGFAVNVWQHNNSAEMIKVET